MRDEFIGEEEEKAWLKALERVTPLEHKKITPPEAKTPPKRAKRITQEILENVPFTAPPEHCAVMEIGDTSRVSRSTARNMATERMPIEASLDLHGLTQAQAQERLVRFIHQCYVNHQRMLLVITGKGKGEGETGVLQQNLPRWLNLPQIRPAILMVDYAKPKDGGRGAFYVLLKRKR